MSYATSNNAENISPHEPNGDDDNDGRSKSELPNVAGKRGVRLQWVCRRKRGAQHAARLVLKSFQIVNLPRLEPAAGRPLSTASIAANILARMPHLPARAVVTVVVPLCAEPAVIEPTC
mmetsp:Transcript_27247/g.45396  ORF Transcript_27247/g.45396 Transcript_27247/m.45396 type:complete len:119 (-) Transcript_27247:206-562(-)